MGCGVQGTNIRVEPMRVFWGREHCRNYIFNGNGSNSGGDYLNLTIIDPDYNQTVGYIWFDDGVASDPAPAGKTLLGSVSILAGDTSAQIVAKVLLAFPFSGVDDFYAKAGESAQEFCLCNKFIGEIDNTAEGTGTANVTKVVEVQGIGGELGATSGGVELSFEAQTIEIKSDQTGEIVLDDIFAGSTASASMSLIELTQGILKTVIAGVSGDALTPSGGTEVLGQGQSKLYNSMYDYAGKLILHPVRIIDVSDRSEDWVFWKSAPLIESVSFSGTEQKALAVNFKAYLDKSLDQKVNLWIQGDWLQDFNA